MSHFHALKIAAVDRLTPNAVALTFDIPENLKEDYSFKAGQYITLKFSLDGKELRRAYSISSPPSSGKLTVGIKKMEGGTFSVYANEQLKAGLSLAAQKYSKNRVPTRSLLKSKRPSWSMQIGPQVNMSSTILRLKN